MAWTRQVNTEFYIEVVRIIINVTPHATVDAVLGVWMNQQSYTNGDEPLFTLSGRLHEDDVPNIAVSLSTIGKKIIVKLGEVEGGLWTTLVEV